MIEVEVKFPLPHPDSFLLAVSSLLQVNFEPDIRERDLFFSHPDRDFAKTDECLRLRTSPHGVFLTYKGRKDNAKIKMREELEFQLATQNESADAVVSKWSSFWSRLGFFPVATVEKSRRLAHACIEGAPVTITCDHIEGLGFFCELEVLAKTVNDVPLARDLILRLADRLGLPEPEIRSYLELFLKKQEE